MKILTFAVRTGQKTDVESMHQENLSFSDLPGFLHDHLLPVLLLPKKTSQSEFKIMLKDNHFQLIHNNQKINLEQQQILELDAMSININVEDIIEKTEEIFLEQEREEVPPSKNIVYELPKAVPKISKDYALMSDHFSATPIKFSNGDILRDLGFTEKNKTSNLIKFW